jgi:hypothetical protein
MPNPVNNPDCPKCRGEGFYLAHEGGGYYRDGSFGHNIWEDCHCSFIDQIKTKDQGPRTKPP